mgnify:FL=1|jgi:hypothetical protein
MATDWRFIGAVEVDSGTLVIGDPCYLLPDARNERPGVDAQALYRTGSPDAAVPIVRDLALLLQRFGGDGRFPVYGRYDGPELVSVRIDFDEPEE